MSAYPPQGSRAHSGYPPQGGVVHAGYPPQGEGVAAPSISYAGSPFTWYDYFTSVSLSVSNSGGAVTSYAVQSGTLPTGVSLNTSTGAITGTPTALKTAANVVIRATGPGGTSDATLNIGVLSMLLWPQNNGGPTLVAGYDTEVGFSSLKSASDGSGGEAADTDPVGYMADLSGNGDHLIQPTSGAKPTLAATGLNGKRCITFDGGDFLLTGALSGGTVAQPNTHMLVMQLGASTSGQIMVDSDGVVGRNVIFLLSNWSIHAGGTVDSGDAGDTNLHLHAALFNGAASKQYLDGAEIGSGDPGAAVQDGLCFGAQQSGVGSFVTAGTKSSMVAIWGGDIGATARTNLHTWAQAKWATPA